MTAPAWNLGWLARFHSAPTIDAAQEIANQALADGADPNTVAAALVEYQLLQDAAVTVWRATS